MEGDNASTASLNLPRALLVKSEGCDRAGTQHAVDADPLLFGSSCR
jgi:hypothetical protein